MKRHLIATICVVALAGCSPGSRSPDAIRQDTAKATAEVTRDAKAVAKGVVEGLRTKGPVNINKASEENLEALPGIDRVAARRIVAGRPYADSRELAKRRIVSHAEYDRIAGQVVAQ